eukprot:1278053-Rhodomonas_salina.2
MLNHAIRSDAAALMPLVATFARTINAQLCTRSQPLAPEAWPLTHQTFRGAVLPTEHLAFYQRMRGRQYRVPGFLATSFNVDTADEFAMRAWVQADCQHPPVRYVVKLDPEGATRAIRRCKHVSLLRKSNVPTEGEFLYAPYSVFRVLSVRCSAASIPSYLDPHVVELLSAVDNMAEPEDLPLAPWY